VRDGAADGGVRVEDDMPGGVVGQPDGQRGDQLAAAGLGQDAAAQPGPDEMQLSFLCRPARYADHTAAGGRRCGGWGCEIGVILHLGYQ
jgi:hypothetical protein